ncbi:fumarylacetoacetate hydrolase family protein [Cohnella fermenti]|uniref:Fumarylacetoacetate hydrolase family protein n=1 Tax=Cohnella fermenti TaxID=2565925 RepID=A0A4S4BNL4_9BACL|nr:fumarylacetoacetate hydrolase family protein [Cohnella fermenti]THF75889.1 fumarylacetoacetate hydrolase family protein [Cohnella fermenti]
MKAVMLKLGGSETAAIATDRGYVPITAINRALGAQWGETLMELLENGQWEALVRWHREAGGRQALALLEAVPTGEAKLAPIVRRPRKIMGLGMNYMEKLIELKGSADDAPVLFAKPDTSLIGDGEPIRLPVQSERVTAEAELAIVIGRECKDVDETEAPAVVAGYAASLDMTAADLLAQNAKYMFRAKSFDSFFSLGSELATADELPEWERLVVETVHNGQTVHRNTVAMMRYNPWHIVSFVSRVMRLLPGDIIMTGTPGSVRIVSGDEAECRISGLAPLRNPVNMFKQA